MSSIGLYIAVAASLLLCGWTLLMAHLLRALQRGQGAGLHAGGVLLGVILGLTALLMILAWALTGQSRWAINSLALMQWGFLPVIYLVVAHRMIPFFAACVLEPYRPYRPAWILLLILALTLGHLALVLGNAPRWLWAVDAPLLLLCAWLAYRWQGWRAGDHRLLLSLFLAWFALILGLGLSVLESASLWFDLRLSGGRSPAHLVSIGFYGAMMLAMATRVTLGHSGRALVMDQLAWVCVLAVVAAGVLRALGGWTGDSRALSIAGGALWTVAVLAWSCRYAPMLWRPRIDGAPG